MSTEASDTEASHGVVIGRMPGHALRRQGAAFNEHGKLINLFDGIHTYCGGEGRGMCSCGVLSEVLPSSYARRKWHWKHKQEVHNAEHA